MKYVVICNAGAKSERMSKRNAMNYAALLGKLGNYNIEVVKA